MCSITMGMIPLPSPPPFSLHLSIYLSIPISLHLSLSLRLEAKTSYPNEKCRVQRECKDFTEIYRKRVSLWEKMEDFRYERNCVTLESVGIKRGRHRSKSDISHASYTCLSINLIYVSDIFIPISLYLTFETVLY